MPKADLPRRALDAPRRLTLGAIAEALGVSVASVKKWREGARQMPEDKRLELADLLEKHAKDLQRIAEQLRR